MKHSDNTSKTSDYCFMNETIKKRPWNSGGPAGKVLLFAVCSLLLGVCAVRFVPMPDVHGDESANNYIGINGATVSDKKSLELDIPQGIYVDTVEADSPAMEAGVQSGDIIYKLDGMEIQNMQEFYEKLQAMESSQETELVVYRYSVDGEYESVELNVKIEQR